MSRLGIREDLGGEFNQGKQEEGFPGTGRKKATTTWPQPMADMLLLTTPQRGEGTNGNKKRESENLIESSMISVKLVVIFV
jgi:hypothetical protein